MAGYQRRRWRRVQFTELSPITVVREKSGVTVGR